MHSFICQAGLNQPASKQLFSQLSAITFIQQVLATRARARTHPPTDTHRYTHTENASLPIFGLVDYEGSGTVRSVTACACHRRPELYNGSDQKPVRAFMETAPCS